jgi:hypothetical protein
MIDYEAWQHELPEWAKDQLTSVVRVQFDWRDRLRLLILGRCTVEVRVDVENAPGKHSSMSIVRVDRIHQWIRWSWQKRMGFGQTMTDNPQAPLPGRAEAPSISGLPSPDTGQCSVRGV